MGVPVFQDSDKLHDNLSHDLSYSSKFSNPVDPGPTAMVAWVEPQVQLIFSPGSVWGLYKERLKKKAVKIV